MKSFTHSLSAVEQSQEHSAPSTLTPLPPKPKRTGSKRNRKNNPSKEGTKRDNQISRVKQEKAQTHPIPHPHLKNRAILFTPLPRHPRMLAPQLQQVPEQRHPGDFRQAFDLRHVGAVEVCDEQVEEA